MNADNYARAEAAFQIESMLKRSGGINKLAHVRQPIPLDRQRNMQMNRDTIYSSAVVDISKGASVSFPNSGDRYMSIAIVNEDNYTTAVYHGGEAIELTMEEHGTPHIGVPITTSKAAIKFAPQLDGVGCQLLFLTQFETFS